jgi:hypothetical protein
MISQFRLEDVVPGLNFDVELAPDKRVYCFIGKNGVGKTKMLEGLGQSLLLGHIIFSFPAQPNQLLKGLWYKYNIDDVLGSETLTVPYAVTIQNIVIKRKSDPNDIWNRLRLEQVLNLHGRNRIYSLESPIIFIPAKGRGYIKNVENIPVPPVGDYPERFIKAFKRTLDAMRGDETASIEIAKWFMERAMLDTDFYVGSTKRLHEVLSVLRLIKALEPSWTDIDDTRENGKPKALAFDEGKLYLRGIAFDHLSTGFASIIRIFQEIIAGYGAWTDTEDLANVEGIVFIDEIESHLHAEWQSKIIPLLKKSFPKTTFFIATHSPLIVSTTDQDEAYELVPEVREEGTFVVAKKLGNPRNWYLADVYEKAFHVDITSMMEDSESVDSTPSVTEMLKDFGILVKDYQGQPSDALKEKIFSLYDEILPNVPDTDPRRSSLELLRRLVK